MENNSLFFYFPRLAEIFLLCRQLSIVYITESFWVKLPCFTVADQFPHFIARDQSTCP